MDDFSNVKVASLSDLLGGMFTQEAPEPEPVSTAPSVFGPKGRAWQLDLSKLREAAISREEDLAEDHMVAAWIIERPEVNPFAHSFMLTLTSLEGVSHKHYVEGSTHEFSIFPVAPTLRRDDMMGGLCPIPIIANDGPIFAAQIAADSHVAAIERLSGAVQEVCNGDLIPDHDEDQAWIDRFGDASLDPEHVDRERAVKAAQRYYEAMHGLEVAAAYAAQKEPRNVEPSYLRNGIDSVNASHSALVKLLIEKGLFTQGEYVEAVADAVETEYAGYAAKLGLPPLESQRADANGDRD